METPSSPHLVSLLGPSGSGKTTLAAALVKRWTDRGLRVGFAKHASHGFQMDQEGKDTERVGRESGAGVLVTGPQGVAYVDPRPEDAPDVLAARFFPGCHVLLLEGFRGAALPAVVIAGKANSREFLDVARGPILAVLAAATGDAAEEAAARALPCFEAADVEGVARCLEDHYGFGLFPAS